MSNGLQEASIRFRELGFQWSWGMTSGDQFWVIAVDPTGARYAHTAASLSDAAVAVTAMCEEVAR